MANLHIDEISRFRIQENGTFSGNHGRLSMEDSLH